MFFKESTKALSLALSLPRAGMISSDTRLLLGLVTYTLFRITCTNFVCGPTTWNQCGIIFVVVRGLKAPLLLALIDRSIDGLID